jgi:hypothetical protein
MAGWFRARRRQAPAQATGRESLAPGPTDGPDARGLLEEYVRAGKVMQLATVDPDGRPYVNNLWFASTLRPDRLLFISRPNRLHCEYIRDRSDVAGAILAIELHDPSQPVQGVTFTGTARELPTTGIDEQIGVDRPRADGGRRGAPPRLRNHGERLGVVRRDSLPGQPTPARCGDRHPRGLTRSHSSPPRRRWKRGRTARRRGLTAVVRFAYPNSVSFVETVRSPATVTARSAVEG